MHALHTLHTLHYIRLHYTLTHTYTHTHIHTYNLSLNLELLAAKDASDTLKDATNSFILSKATDEDRDVKERFVDQRSKDIQSMSQWVHIIIPLTFLKFPVLSDSRSACSLESSLVQFLAAWVDRMEDQQLQRAHAAAEDLLTESQVSGFASNGRKSLQVIVGRLLSVKNILTYLDMLANCFFIFLPYQIWQLDIPIDMCWLNIHGWAYHESPTSCCQHRWLTCTVASARGIRLSPATAARIENPGGAFGINLMIYKLIEQLSIIDI